MPKASCGATCSYPCRIEFRVESAGKTVSVYSNDYFNISLSATGFTPEGGINPGTDFEGKKARVQYTEVSDEAVDGLGDRSRASQIGRGNRNPDPTPAG